MKNVILVTVDAVRKDVFYDSMEDEVEPRIPYIRGNIVNQKAMDWLASYSKSGSKKPFFLWLHYMDVHE